MSIFLGILLTLVILLIVVMIHEFGHFITARLTGMKVEEFGIGIPPRAKSFGKDKQGTEYTLNWLPIGGFVRILGEDIRDGEAPKKGAFITKPLASRVLVLAAGVIMNFFLAFVVFTGLFLYGTNPMTIIPMDGNQSQLLPSTSEALKSGFLTHSGIQISPLSGSIASRAGAFSGDIIVSIAGTTPRSSQDVIDIIRKNEPFDIVLESSGGEKKIRMTPESGKVGMVVGYKNLNINKSIELKYNFPEAIVMGGKETVATTRITFDFLGRMLVGLISPKTDTERQEAKDMLSGPIGLGSTFVSIVENNVPISIILVMIALLSINLGVVNILPFPALDGGRIVTTILYSIAWYIPGGKKYFPTLEGALHTIGFLLLIGFMLYVSGLDISRFF